MEVKGKVLIVDDDADFTRTTGMILESGGYDVAIAPDAKKGLDDIRAVKPDVVLLDIMMESMFEGFSFLTTLRTAPEFEEFKSTPVLMVSSVRSDTGSRFMFDDAEDMGGLSEPDDYMDKPLKPNALLGKVASLIRRPR